MRIAVVHHWFVTQGGGERVAEYIASLFPAAEMFTLVSDSKSIPPSILDRKWHHSFLQRIPFAPNNHRYFMPLYSRAAESLDARKFDLVISSDSGPVKGVRTDGIHICYCHSPMRYLYDSYDEYRSQMGFVTRGIFTATAGTLRKRDVQASQNVHHFIANSNYVADRIRRFYGRESTVIHPPIDVHKGRVDHPGEHYLCAGRLVSYKRTDLLIRACQKLGRKLRIVGAGPEERSLRRIAGDSVVFLGELSTDDLWNEYARCRALLFAADEDFGMVPLEAQACGRPVIAYGHGGSLETVRGRGPDATGVFFPEQNVEAIMQAILNFETKEKSFVPARIQAHAAEFDSDLFLSRLRSFILEVAPHARAEMAPFRSTRMVPSYHASGIDSPTQRGENPFELESYRL